MNLINFLFLFLSPQSFQNSSTQRVNPPSGGPSSVTFARSKRPQPWPPTPLCPTPKCTCLRLASSRSTDPSTGRLREWVLEGQGAWQVDDLILVRLSSLFERHCLLLPTSIRSVSSFSSRCSKRFGRRVAPAAVSAASRQRHAGRTSGASLTSRTPLLHQR